MPSPRYCSGATSVPGVGVVVVGGYEEGNGSLCTAELLSCSTGGDGVERWSWRQLAPMLTPCASPGVAYFKGRVVVAGDVYNDKGAECLRLPTDDNDLGQWTQLRGFKDATPRAMSLIVLNEGLLVADCSSNVHKFVPASDANTLDLEKFIWKPIFRFQNMNMLKLLVLRKQR